MNNEQPIIPTPTHDQTPGTPDQKPGMSRTVRLLSSAAVGLAVGGAANIGIDALPDHNASVANEQQQTQEGSALQSVENRLDAALANKSVIESHKPSPTDTTIGVGTAVKFGNKEGSVEPGTEDKQTAAPEAPGETPGKITVDDSDMVLTPLPTDSPTPVEAPTSTETPAPVETPTATTTATPAPTPDTIPTNDYETGQAESDTLAPEAVAVMDQLKADILDPNKSRTYPTGLVEVNVGKGYAIIDKAALAYDPVSHLVFAAWENPNAPSDDVTAGILGNIYGNLRVLTTDGANEAGTPPTLETSTGAVHVEDNHFTDTNGNTFGTQLAEEPPIYHSYQLTLDANGALAIGPEIPKGTGVIDPVPLPTDGSPVMK